MKTQIIAVGFTPLVFCKQSERDRGGERACVCERGRKREREEKRVREWEKIEKQSEKPDGDVRVTPVH